MVKAVASCAGCVSIGVDLLFVVLRVAQYTYAVVASTSRGSVYGSSMDIVFLFVFDLY